MLPDSSQPVIKLSVVIITLNEERNIARCLKSVQEVADEIVVLDSGSVDGTGMICKDNAVHYFEQPFSRYDLQKNEATRKAVYDHILSLDADEALTEELKDAILEVKHNWQHDAYAFNRLTYYCGKWIRHGEWYPNRLTRLFDRRKASWSGQLHERLILENPRSLGFLKGDLLHYSYYSVSQYLHKSDLYTDISSMELYAKGIKPWIYHFYFKPLYRFFYAFMIRKGFLDGYTGYTIAKLTANRLFLRYAKLKSLQDRDRNKAQEQKPDIHSHRQSIPADD